MNNSLVYIWFNWLIYCHELLVSFLNHCSWCSNSTALAGKDGDSRRLIDSLDPGSLTQCIVLQRRDSWTPANDSQGRHVPEQEIPGSKLAGTLSALKRHNV